MTDKKGPLGPAVDDGTVDLLGLGASSSSAAATIPLIPQPMDVAFTPTTSQAGDDDLPPSYDEEGTSLLSHPSHNVPAGATNAVPSEPPPDFTPYIAEHSEHPKSGQVTSYDSHLNEDGEALYRFLLTQNMFSPRPQVRMRGTHVEEHHHYHHRNSDDGSTRSSTEHRTVVDFDIIMNFQSLILIEPGQQGIMQVVDDELKTYRGGRFRKTGGSIRSLPIGTPIIPKTMRDWADNYCADRAICKEFVMEKICPGYDTKYLETQLYQLIQSTNYGGDIQITFPTTHSKVKVRPANKLTQLRYNRAARWFCYLTFLWLITWPLLWFMTRKYNVVRSVWPMSAVGIDGRRRVKMTEEQWFDYWRLAIRRAVLGQRQGMVTEQDLIEIAAESDMPRMQTRAGNQPVDNMVGGAVDVLTVMTQQRQVFGWGRNETSRVWNLRWGGDESHWDS
ncbi:hypothetical protein DRE_04273 [Drechslerella stenobrocha 248]|uniref:Uncharacterized protein n=1 Tax=Drechslerella stenobrocha 248 TaxID=1043628 RepID=W7IBV8_9PEZI|nr:hypothetical protein DRE_04273 [Drechslerella stenobrocha 248]